MKDEVLNGFVEKILEEEIDNEKFENYVNIFSRFLGYTNPDYKYNGTYLSRYITDFVQLHQMLKKKNEKYYEIFMTLIGLRQKMELLADQSFFATFLSKSEIERRYVGINKVKIKSQKIEIRIEIESENKEYVFCREYDDFEESGLAEKICNDVKKYINMTKN